MLTKRELFLADQNYEFEKASTSDKRKISEIDLLKSYEWSSKYKSYK